MNNLSHNTNTQSVVALPGVLTNTRISRMADAHFPTLTSFKSIPLTQGFYSLVDTEDYYWLNKHKWSVAKRIGVTYAQTANKSDGKWQPILMHKLIMQPPDGFVVDHINENGLDNRRCNLRLSNKAQNVINSSKKKIGNSKYTGVHFSKGTLSWHAYITFDKKRKHIGCFDTEEEARLARAKYEVEYYGDFSRLKDHL